MNRFAFAAALTAVLGAIATVPAQAEESATLKKIGYMHSEVGKS